MKWKEGRPDIMDFGVGDIETPFKRLMQSFITECLDAIPPKLALVYPHTTGNPIVDGGYWEGQRPTDPLTLRLYIGAFLPDDGTSIIYESTLPEMIQESFKRYPKPETMQEVYDALEKQMQVIKDYIANYKEPVGEYEDDDED